MKPRDAILNALETFVEPWLEQHDFKLRRGSLAFVRKDGLFTQRIETQLNRWNMEDILASFDISVSVRSSYYVNWHKEQYDVEPPNDGVADSLCRNLNGWKEGRKDVSHPEAAERQMLDLRDDLLNIAIPFLKYNSDWCNAAERLIEQEWFHGKACDFYLIAGDRDNAYLCLEKALETWRKYPERTFFLGEKEGIQHRFLKHFGETRWI